MHEITVLEPEKLKAAGMTKEEMEGIASHTLTYIKKYVRQTTFQSALVRDT